MLPLLAVVPEGGCPAVDWPAAPLALLLELPAELLELLVGGGGLVSGVEGLVGLLAEGCY